MPFDPMSGFQAMQQGMEMGQAGGNFAGVGQMIRNVLDKASKLGMVRAQSQYQNQGAMDLAILKAQAEQAANQKMWDEYAAATGGVNPSLPNVQGDYVGNPVEVGGKIMTRYTGRPIDPNAFWNQGGSDDEAPQQPKKRPFSLGQ